MLPAITITLLVILIVWGNLVAGLEAGLACPDWPLCYGKFIPPFRIDIYLEFLHRVLAAITSIFIFILCYRRFKTYSEVYRSLPVITVLLLLLQIVLGGITVLLKLPASITTSHFAIAFIIFSLLLFFAYFDGEKRKPHIPFSGTTLFVFFLTLFVFVQAVLGAYVRHTQSGLACPDFPLCLGYVVPPVLQGSILLHFSHRVMGYLLFAVFLGIFIYNRFGHRLKSIRNYLDLIFYAVLMQIVLGAMVVLSQLAFYVAAIHLILALLIFSLALVAWFKSAEERFIK